MREGEKERWLRGERERKRLDEKYLRYKLGLKFSDNRYNIMVIIILKC